MWGREERGEAGKPENPELPHNVQYVLYKKRKDPYVVKARK
jgi:hypothetical protein